MGNSSSKTGFGKSLQRLSSEDIDAGEQEFWDQLWKTPLSAEEIFEVMSPEAVRSLISQRPGNLQTLFTQAVAQLYQVVETPYPIYFDQALNCARILSRLLPFILENTSSFSTSVTPVLRRLLWQKQKVPKGSDGGKSSRRRERSQSSDDNSEDGKDHSDVKDDNNAASPEKKTGHDGHTEHHNDESDEEEQETEPLAVILINSIFHLLFLPDFTIEDPNMDFNEQDLGTQTFKSALMWAPGVGCAEKTLANSSQYDKNRIEILRLMISSFSDSLYQNPDTYDSCESLWLEVGTSPDVPYAEIAFCSLMNVVLGYDPIGYGLPYGQYMSGDTAFPLMEVSVQALIILLDYGLPIAPEGEGQGYDSSAYVAADDEHATGFNIFRRMLRDIEDTKQLNFIFRGFSRLLNNVYKAQTTILPYAATKISIEQELMVLLWKCLEENPAFMPFILKESKCNVNELVVPICFFLLDGRQDPAKLGMLYLCTFVLLKLSGERSFSVSLNQTFKAHLPVDMPQVQGSHADLLIITLHKLMVSGMDKLSSLYTCFLTIICNISPYCKSLSAPASLKLVNLVELFASPRILFAAENNYSSVVMLLESLNNLVQYQYEGNFNLVFYILTRRKVFEWLSSFTLPGEGQEPALLQQPGQPRGGSGVSGQQQQQSVREVDPSVTPSEHSSAQNELSCTETATNVISVKEEEENRETSRSESQEGGDQKSSGELKADESGDLDNNNDTNTNNNDDNNTDNNNTDDNNIDHEDARGTTAAAKDDNDAGGDNTVADETTQGEGKEVKAVSSVPPPPPPTTAGASTAQESKEDPATQEERPFVPSEQWAERVKKELPLHTLVRLVRHLVPLVEEMAATGKKMDELTVIGFIRRTTMVGLLPVPHPIVIRKYQPNRHTSLWFTAFMWGVIFLHCQSSPKLFDGRAVRLFMVQGGDKKKK